MTLNPFLSSHTPSLLSHIRTRGIVQYFSPFSSVRISNMATAFGIDEKVMLSEVCDLAERGDIVGIKIDLVDGVIKLESKDPRAEAFRNTLIAGPRITRTAIGSTFRMQLKEANIVVCPREREVARQQSGRSFKIFS